MKIYLAGTTGRFEEEFVVEIGASRLFSYFLLIGPDASYGAYDRFNEIIESNKHEDLSLCS